MSETDFLPLTALSAELRRRNLVNPVPPYRLLYNAILDGRIPAQRGANGRWYWRSKDLPEIAQAFQHWALLRNSGMPRPGRPPIHQ